MSALLKVAGLTAGYGGVPVIESIADSVVFSTDFPHGDSAFPHAVDTFLDQPLAAATKRKILWDNTARMYGWVI